MTLYNFQKDSLRDHWKLPNHCELRSNCVIFAPSQNSKFSNPSVKPFPNEQFFVISAWLLSLNILASAVRVLDAQYPKQVFNKALIEEIIFFWAVGVSVKVLKKCRYKKKTLFNYKIGHFAWSVPCSEEMILAQCSVRSDDPFAERIKVKESNI